MKQLVQQNISPVGYKNNFRLNALHYASYHDSRNKILKCLLENATQAQIDSVTDYVGFFFSFAILFVAF